VDEFQIVQGDTLDNPQFLENDGLRKFDVIMANPPYSVKRWNQGKWMNDPFGRNIWGTPPQGNADYAFQQHIMSSLKPDTGRCVVLWPHGVLFRDVEADIRRKMIEGDYVDAVIGLGKNLFYNSSMESCLLVCRMQKPVERKGKIVFIDARDELQIERNSAWLDISNINKICDAYYSFSSHEGFSNVVTIEDVMNKQGNLSVQLHVSQPKLSVDNNISKTIVDMLAVQQKLNESLDIMLDNLKSMGIDL